MSELEDRLEAEAINKKADEIVSAIEYFKHELEKTELQHDDASAFGETIQDYANAVISKKMR